MEFLVFLIPIQIPLNQNAYRELRNIHKLKNFIEIIHKPKDFM